MARTRQPAALGRRGGPPLLPRHPRPGPSPQHPGRRQRRLPPRPPPPTPLPNTGAGGNDASFPATAPGTGSQTPWPVQYAPPAPTQPPSVSDTGSFHLPPPRPADSGSQPSTPPERQAQPHHYHPQAQAQPYQ